MQPFGTILLLLLSSAALVLLGHVFRLLRWEQFIRIYEYPQRRSLLRAMAGGYAVNFLLPFHVGDFLRAALAGRKMKTGTGFAFAAKMETQYLPESIKEDIMVSAKFLPDPAIYTKYSPYGITISSDGKMLQYDGQRVRLFVDEHSEVEAFFLDEAGELDLAVNRNEAGIITGIESISDVKAQQYCADFFANDLNPSDTPDIPQDFAVDVATDIVGQNKYEQYSAYGIILSSDGKVLNYDGQRVKLFADMLSDGSFEVYWFDEAGTVNLSVVRNASDQITAIESITEKQAEEYRSALDIYEQNALIGLDDKVSEKVNNQFPEN